VSAPDEPRTVPPGAKSRALAEEQVHVDRVHARVDTLRARALERTARIAATREGSTFQARYERDVTAHHHAARAARFTFGDVESLVFGRIDTADADHLHIGRVSVIDEAGDVLLVDWRARAAAAFYRATAAHPEQVVRRRTLTTRGRRVLDLDDELFDADAADRLGLVCVTGQGALLASLARVRGHAMQDIVATIQRDQDRIIRTPARGTLVVTGGPGTGKTVVALHRVAYLLYHDRDRFEGRGVLVVGPSRAFTEYTSRVLPALGEDRAVQRPIGMIGPPGVTATAWESAELAEIKGELAWVEIVRRLLAAALPPIPPRTRISVDRTGVTLDGAELSALRARHLQRLDANRPGGTYLARADAANAGLEQLLWRKWQDARRAEGASVPETPSEVAFASGLETAPQMTMLRRCYWPRLDAREVLTRVASGAIDLSAVAAGLLPDGQLRRLQAAWSQAGDWCVGDVAILDELDALIGHEQAEAPADDDPGLRVTGDAGPAPPRVDLEDPRYRDFAHVVVDEAQDLTPLQWRAVARRGPYASWTVVGDLAQRSRTGRPETWREVASLIGRRNTEIRELTVNYRTPIEIDRVAGAVLAEMAGELPARPRPVRAAGTSPRLVRAPDPIEACAREVADLLASADGTIGVVAPEHLVEQAQRALDGVSGDVAGRVRVLDPRNVKGLEFDDVVVLAPDEIAGAPMVGLHQLYVAVTRATRTLCAVARPDVEVPAASAFAADGPSALPAPISSAGDGA
jgi:hypothetical protein